MVKIPLKLRRILINSTLYKIRMGDDLFDLLMDYVEYEEYEDMEIIVKGIADIQSVTPEKIDLPLTDIRIEYSDENMY